MILSSMSTLTNLSTNDSIDDSAMFIQPNVNQARYRQIVYMRSSICSQMLVHQCLKPHVLQRFDNKK